MSGNKLENLNVASQEALITPEALKKEMPLSDKAAETVSKGRQAIYDIMDGKDHRLFVVVGPCSIHDVEAARDYAARLKKLADEVSDTLLIVMRVYFEKPRTTVGWKGLINDPHLNDTFDIEQGLHIGRRLLLDINELGLPAATEALDPISPQYLQDTIAWSAIGARTTESQTHREMSSGLSMAIGFKNGTDGSLGIDQQGQVAIIRTKGNNYGHVVLRGGGGKPNYDSVSVALCEQALDKAGLRKSMMIDCSHANSSKDPAIQPLVMQDVTHQILEGNTSIQSLMVESNINWGNQSIPENLADLKYGVSVTDACIDWPTTEKAIRDMRDKLKDVLPKRKIG